MAKLIEDQINKAEKILVLNENYILLAYEGKRSIRSLKQFMKKGNYRMAYVSLNHLSLNGYTEYQSVCFEYVGKKYEFTIGPKVNSFALVKKFSKNNIDFVNK